MLNKKYTIALFYYSFDEIKSEIKRYIKYYNEQQLKEKLGLMDESGSIPTQTLAYMKISVEAIITTRLKKFNFFKGATQVDISFLSSHYPIIFNS